MIRMMLMHDDACCMMMRDSLSLQGVSNEQDYDAQQDAAEHPPDAVWCNSATGNLSVVYWQSTCFTHISSTLSSLMKVLVLWRSGLAALFILKFVLIFHRNNWVPWGTQWSCHIKWSSTVKNYWTILSGTGAHGKCATFDVMVEANGAELLLFWFF